MSETTTPDRVIHKTLPHAKLGVMADIGYIQKKKSPDGGIKYAFLSEEDLVFAAHDACLRHGLTLSIPKVEISRSEQYTTKNGTTMNASVLLVTYRLTHADSGQTEESMATGEGFDVGDKGCNKAMTGALKYFLRQSFIIPSGADPDRAPSEPMERARPAKAQPSGAAANGAKPADPYQAALKAIKTAASSEFLARVRERYQLPEKGFKPTQLHDLETACAARLAELEAAKSSTSASS